MLDISDKQRLQIIETLLSNRQISEESEALSGSLKDFIVAAWHTLKPDDEFIDNWHLDAYCEYLEAISKRELHRLQIWVPPVSMKTLVVNVMWPAWEWTREPNMRYICASYSEPLAALIAADARTVLRSDWYQERWGQKFEFTSESILHLANDRGGTRLSVSPEGKVTGRHANRIIVDDPIKPSDAEATSRATLEGTNRWWDSTLSSRGIPNDHARILVMQRLHENDLAAHLLEKGYYEVLCLPERYEKAHPFAWERDPRSEGDLLWPEFRDEESSEEMAREMLSFRRAAQMQQRPATMEGEILKRHWWRFYNPRLFTDGKLKERRPKFRMVVVSVDTPLKDRESNDLIAVQAWGIVGGDRYLLDLWKGHANFSQAKSQILRISRDVRKMFPNSAHHVLIENAGYGVELIQELKREIPGVTKISRGGDGDKVLRAESASADLESGNCYLPGFRLGADEYSLPDEARCPADVVDFIDSCAVFPNGRHDDDVDAWSQCMNWLRTRSVSPMRRSSPFRRRR